MRSAGRTTVAVGAVALGIAACSPGAPEHQRGQQPPTTSAPTTSAVPSTPRHVPPQERVRLSGLTAEDICGLVSPEELSGLAFPVAAGTPRRAGVEPRVPGCEFAAPDESSSVLLGAQPAGFVALGREEVEFDEQELGNQGPDDEGPGDRGAEATTPTSPTTSAQQEPLRATRTLRANSCTVYTAVAGATLQVTLVQPESGTDQCELAEDVTTYVAPALVE